jgi:hypothetical protein
MRLGYVAVILGVALIVAGAPPVHATEQVPMDRPGSVLLDGVLSDLETASQHHCHDIGVALLTCFRSASARDHDAGTTLTTVALNIDDDQAVASSSSGYVVAWELMTYAGSSVVLSQNYSNLGTIGWNDRISSYKVYTTGSGTFYEHTFYAGRTQQFCCYAQVSSVGTLNNTFSAFYLP